MIEATHLNNQTRLLRLETVTQLSRVRLVANLR